MRTSIILRDLAYTLLRTARIFSLSLKVAMSLVRIMRNPFDGGMSANSLMRVLDTSGMTVSVSILSMGAAALPNSSFF